MTNETYINLIGGFAVADYPTSKLLPSTVIAQAIHESNWGTSSLAVQANNHFGIKASAPWTGAVFNKNTGEETATGQTIFVDADFRKYASLEAGVKDHGAFLTTGWRKDHYKVYGVTDAQKVIENLKAGGYATDSAYVAKCMRYIKEYNLTTWDEKVLATTTGGINTMGLHLVIAGHGDGDPGALGNGYNERDLTLEVTNLLDAQHENIHAYTAHNVYAQGTLATVAKGYDTVTEIHFNAFNKTAKGTEVLIHSTYEPDGVDTKLLSVLSKYFQNRGIKKRSNLANINIAYNKGINYRLVEICFIDNAEDIKIYQANKNRIAKEMAEAILGMTLAAPAPAPAPAPKPAPTPTPVPTPTHTVAKGDTLYGISKKYNTTVASIKQINGLTSDTLLVGQKLNLTGGGVVAPAPAPAPAPVPSRVAKNYHVRIIAPGFSIDSKPWGEEGFKNLGATDAFLGKIVPVTEETGNGAYINTSIGWIDKRALTATPERKIVSYRASIALAGYSIDSLPYGEAGFVNWNKTDAFLNQNVDVTEETMDGAYAYTNLGWVDKKALGPEKKAVVLEPVVTSSTLTLPRKQDWVLYPTEGPYVVGKVVSIEGENGPLSLTVLGERKGGNVLVVDLPGEGIVGILYEDNKGATITKTYSA